MSKTLGACAVGSVLAMAFALAAQSAAPPSVNDSMTKVMSVNAQTIWDISSNAFNKRGDGLVASKVRPKDWAQLEQAASAINTRALYLAKAPRNLVVATPDEHVLGEEASHGGVKHTYDAANRQQIKGLIDADPAGFSKKANTLARSMQELIKASKTRDIKGLYRVSSNLDELCDGCHEPFWGTDEPPAPSKAMKTMRPLGK